MLGYLAVQLHYVLPDGKTTQIINAPGIKSFSMKNKNISKNYLIKIGYILILFSFSICYSQSLFEKTYQVNSGGMYNTSSIVTGDYLVWSGVTLPFEDGITMSPSTNSYGAIITLNLSGDTLWTIVKGDTTYNFTYLSACDNKDGTFFISGDEADLNNLGYLYFIEQYNYQSSNLLNRFTFTDSIHFNTSKMIRISSGKLILGGFLDNPSGPYLAAIKAISSTGNILWHLELPAYSTTVNQVFNLFEDNDKNIIGSMIYLDASYDDHLINFRIDTIGQIISVDTFPQPAIAGFGYAGMYYSSDYSTLYVQGNFTNPNFFDVVSLTTDSMSSVVNIVDTIGGIYTEYLYNSQKTEFDFGLLSGVTVSPSNGLQEDAFCIFLDSLGKMVHTFNFGDIQYKDIFFSTEKVNNTFISFGNSIRNTPNGLRNLAYIVRYDSLGNVSTGNVESLKEQAVQVFPNPAKDHFKILAPKEHSNTKFHYSLLNQQGKVLVSDSFINETQVSVSEYSGQQLCFLIVQGENYFQAFKIVIE